jgi:hypothetical protein
MCTLHAVPCAQLSAPLLRASSALLLHSIISLRMEHCVDAESSTFGQSDHLMFEYRFPSPVSSSPILIRSFPSISSSIFPPFLGRLSAQLWMNGVQYLGFGMSWFYGVESMVGALSIAEDGWIPRWRDEYLRPQKLCDNRNGKFCKLNSFALRACPHTRPFFIFRLFPISSSSSLFDRGRVPTLSNFDKCQKQLIVALFTVIYRVRNVVNVCQ